MTLPPSPGDIVMIPGAPVPMWGPGIPLALHAGVPFPMPSTAEWNVIVGEGDTNTSKWTFQINSTANPLIIQPMVTHEPIHTSQPAPVFPNGQDQQIVATLQLEGGGPADATGTLNVTWDTTAGLPAVIEAKGSGSGGLTEEQSTQIAQTNSATWPQFLVDTLTLNPLTSGPQGGVVAGNLTSPVFGVIIRIASVPPDWVPQTPDDNYWVPTLAVCRIFRGSDLWLRVPIHTSSKLINLWVEGLSLGLADAVLNAGWLLNLSIQVFFADGVTGEVFLMRVP